MHLRKDDVRHDRGPICRYPHEESRLWECPACQTHKSSTHRLHTHEPDKCQWAEAQTRVTHKRTVRAAPDAAPEVLIEKDPLTVNAPF
jgi:hypothetical protein